MMMLLSKELLRLIVTSRTDVDIYSLVVATWIGK